MNNDLTILLSASSSPTMPGLIKCFKNNGERNIKIVGVDMNDEASAHFMVDKFYCVPPATDENYVDILLDICKKEKVDIYFPNISAEVSAVSIRKKEFEQIGTKLSISNQNSIDIANDKLKVYDFLKEHQVKVPNYYPVCSVEDFIINSKKLGFPNKPVCLKIVNESGSRGVRIIDHCKNRYDIFAHQKPNSFFTSYEDMISILQEAKNIDNMLLVEYMPGNEYSVDALADKGKTLYIVGRENTESIMSIAQESEVKKIESAYEDSKKTIELLNFDGNVGFDFMLNEDGIPFLMDINPRITATVSVIAAAGVNLPYLRIKQLLGEDLQKCDVNYGVKIRRRYHEWYYDSNGNALIF